MRPFSQASMTRSRRSRHVVPKSSPLQHKKHKKTRRSVTFASSPVKPRQISPKNQDPFENDIFDDDDNGDDDDDDTAHSESESESLFLWEEESTLLDDLMDKPKMKLNDDPSVLALTRSLRDAFVNRGHASKAELAHTFVSANTEIKKCLNILDDKAEPMIGKELIRYNNACKQAEKKCLRITEIIEKFEVHKAVCNRLEEQIEAHFAERDALYARFEEFADNTLNPVLGRLKDLPARNERWVAQMFEDLKAIEKKYDDNAVSKILNHLGLC